MTRLFSRCVDVVVHSVETFSTSNQYGEENIKKRMKSSYTICYPKYYLRTLTCTEFFTSKMHFCKLTGLKLKFQAVAQSFVMLKKFVSPSARIVDIKKKITINNVSLN
jgi:hypothetical protein